MMNHRLTTLLLGALAPIACALPHRTGPYRDPVSVPTSTGGAAWEARQSRGPSASNPHAGDAPACLHPSFEAIPAQCRARPSAWRVTCDEGCVSQRLPEEAQTQFAGGLVHVTYTVGRDGVLEDARAVDDPGCGFHAAAPGALRRCCFAEAVPGSRLADAVGSTGCHALAFRYATPE